MKIALILALSCVTASGELPARFVRAVNMTETSGRTGAIVGDNGKALGPLQIHRAYWYDSGMKGSYSQCADLNYSSKVMESYLRRFCASAVASNDFETMAKVHNGGPNGARLKATESYWRKVKGFLK